MNKINDNNFTEWIGRFLNAETSLAEERELYAYFSRRDLPEGARRYRAMVGWYEGLGDNATTGTSAPVSSPVRILPLRLWQLAGIAAVIAVLLTIGLTLNSHRASGTYIDEDGYICNGYMIRDGKRITDMSVVTAEMERISHELDSDFDNVDSYIDRHTAEINNEILSSYDISDPEVSAFIRAALEY